MSGCFFLKHSVETVAVNDVLSLKAADAMILLLLLLLLFISNEYDEGSAITLLLQDQLTMSDVT